MGAFSRLPEKQNAIIRPLQLVLVISVPILSVYFCTKRGLDDAGHRQYVGERFGGLKVKIRCYSGMRVQAKHLLIDSFSLRYIQKEKGMKTIPLSMSGQALRCGFKCPLVGSTRLFGHSTFEPIEWR